MSGYELFKEMSELDDDLIMAPKKFVSLRMNGFLCIIAANISRAVPKGHRILSAAVFLLSFILLYGAAYWRLNRRRKNKLMTEDMEAP